MTSAEPVKFKGVPGSPYTRKMLAYLRYRHIRYELLIGDQTKVLGLPEPRVQLLPTFYLHDDRDELVPVVDSTPLIRRFEAEINGRAAIPGDPVLAFLNYLIEDYADEWLTKAMFHYRWRYAADIATASRILPRWSGIQASEQELETRSRQVAQRQISRLYVVGSNDVTAPVIEASYLRLLGLLDALIQRQRFVLGARPASADFALYGQLTQLAKFDPTPTALCLERAPRVYAWTDLVDDLSGHPGDSAAWLDVASAREALGPLLGEIGRVHAPALIANADALRRGAQRVETTIDGQPWQQQPFPYQAKCLQWINQEHAMLSADDQHRVAMILAGTGCEALLNANSVS